MEYTETEELLKSLGHLINEIRLQLDNLDQSFQREIETLQLQINNLRS
ncbi:MAG: hypothetical protein LBB11_03450 [Puniceicoccales bacterium]|nr:hypothetical protein [Puniceicoccales bacterium]